MNTNSNVIPEKVITRVEFRMLTNMSRSKEYRLSRKGLLPAPFLLDGKIQGYPESDYRNWLKKNTVVGDSK
jgi:predicted DNA-binding transcriptional regulator AlpA